MKERPFFTVIFGLAVTAFSIQCAFSQQYGLYWGDLHNHTNYSGDSPRGAGDPESALLFARDSARLDFVSVTDHDTYMEQEEWDDLQVRAAAFNDPGNFVAFIGYEFTSMYGTTGYGHKCVIFRDDDVPPSVNTVGINLGVPNLWDNTLDGYVYYSIPHHTSRGEPPDFVGQPPPDGHGLSTDWDYVNAAFMPVVEIYSKHGSSDVIDAQEATEGFIEKGSVSVALLRWLEDGDPGYKLGIIAGTDDHSGRPGGVWEDGANWQRGIGPTCGGLTAVYARSRTREDIFDGIGERRVYGTSGPRIRLDFFASSLSDTVPMGGTIEGGGGTIIRFSAGAAGDTEAIDSIQLFRNETLVYTVSGDTLIYMDTVSERTFYRVKAYQVPTTRINGETLPEMAWSSPIWFEPGETDVAVPQDIRMPAQVAMVYFNPVLQQGVAVKYVVPGAWSVSISLYNLEGRLLMRESRYHDEPGTYESALTPVESGPGLYYTKVRLDTLP